MSVPAPRDRRVRPYGWEEAQLQVFHRRVQGPVTSSSGHILGWHGWVRARPRTGACGQSPPMIYARMMPVRKSKVHCSTADPTRNPCPPTAHARTGEHARARGCFFPTISAERARGNMPCKRKSAMPGRVYLLGCFCSWLWFCSLIIPPTVPQV
jgi:hypothetical protein